MGLADGQECKSDPDALRSVVEWLLGWGALRGQNPWAPSQVNEWAALLASLCIRQDPLNSKSVLVPITDKPRGH